MHALRLSKFLVNVGWCTLDRSTFIYGDFRLADLGFSLSLNFPGKYVLATVTTFEVRAC